MTRPVCGHCKGTGFRPLRPRHALVLAALRETAWVAMPDLRTALARQGSTFRDGALIAILHALHRDGLIERRDTGRGGCAASPAYVWKRVP